MKKKLATLAAAVAAAAALTIAPLAAPPESIIAAPSAEAAYPYQCKWKWQRLPGPWWTNNYGWVQHCYQIPR